MGHPMGDGRASYPPQYYNTPNQGAFQHTPMPGGSYQHTPLPGAGYQHTPLPPRASNPSLPQYHLTPTPPPFALTHNGQPAASQSGGYAAQMSTGPQPMWGGATLSPEVLSQPVGTLAQQPRRWPWIVLSFAAVAVASVLAWTASAPPNAVRAPVASANANGNGSPPPAETVAPTPHGPVAPGTQSPAQPSTQASTQMGGTQTPPVQVGQPATPTSAKRKPGQPPVAPKSTGAELHPDPYAQGQ
jgi:hypothetical protein